MSKRLLPVTSILLLAISLSFAKTQTGAVRLPTKEQLELAQEKRALKAKLEAFVERPMKAAQAKLKREKLEELKKARKPEFQKSEQEKVVRTFRKAAKWQRFGHRGFLSERMFPLRKSATGSVPTVLINGSSAATVAAGETFQVSITFSTGEDSALVDVFFDADGDTVVDATDISLFGFLPPDMEGDEGPEAPFWIYDNSDEDENPADGEFLVTVDDFPYMGFSAIFQATDGGGTGQAYLTIDNLTGDYTASGTVSPITAPALVMFSHEFEDEPFMTFTDGTGSFSFNFLDLEGGFFLGAMDVVLGVETGGYLLHGVFFEDANDLEGVTLDITRDAKITGTVVDAGDGSGIEDAWIEAFTEGFHDVVIAFAVSSADGTFELPLQSGHVYAEVGSYHPEYMWEFCIDYPLYVSAGDALEVTCELDPWPAFVEGHVTDAETSDPLEDIAVEIRIWDHDGHGGPMIGDKHDGDKDMDGFRNEAWTDEDGFYRLGTIFGEGELCAFDWDEREYQGICIHPFVVDKPSISHDFQLHPYDGAITGVITDASTNDPLRDADVWAYSEDIDVGQWDWTDDDGSYKLPVVNGTYTVCAEKWWEGYGQECVENVVVTDNVVPVNIPLNPPDGIIKGFVYDAVTDEPLSGIGVDVYSYDNDYYYLYTETNDSGFFKIGVNNGTYEVCFYDWDWTRTYEDTCVSDIVVSDDTREITMYLTPIDWDGAISGEVKDNHGNPVEALVVAVDTSQWEWEGNATITGMGGGYLLPLMNGNYLAVAFPFSWGYLWDIETGKTVNFDTVDVDFVTSVVTVDAMIAGSVTDTLDNPLEDAWVEASPWFDFGGWWFDGVFFETETDESGSYELDVMGFDDRYYWVYADYWDYETGDLWVGGVDSVAVGSGDSVTVDLVLRPIIYSSEICGYVTRDGKPVAGAEVWAKNTETGEEFVMHTDENGYFCMGIFNGEYDICVTVDDQMEMCDYVDVFDEQASRNFAFGIVSVEDKAPLPERFALHQNHPNPFNPVTTIQYDLPEETTVQLTLYDILGHEVATLVDDRQLAGYHTVTWDGRDRSGDKAATGVYIYQLKTDGFVETKKLILLR